MHKVKFSERRVLDVYYAYSNRRESNFSSLPFSHLCKNLFISVRVCGEWKKLFPFSFESLRICDAYVRLFANFGVRLFFFFFFFFCIIVSRNLFTMKFLSSDEINLYVHVSCPRARVSGSKQVL